MNKAACLLICCLFPLSCSKDPNAPAKRPGTGTAGHASKSPAGKGSAVAPDVAAMRSDVDLPVAHHAAPDRDPAPDRRLVFGLTRNGEIRFGRKTLSLSALATTLEEQKRLYDMAMRKKGLSGYEVVSGGIKASRLLVLLCADGDAVWQHVQWFMTILAEQKIHKLQFATRSGDAETSGKPRTYGVMAADLPVNRDANPLAEPFQRIAVSVHIVAHKETPAKWGPAGRQSGVTMPTRFKYKFSDRESADVRAVTHFIVGAKKAMEGMDDGEDFRVHGEIKAGHKVPFKYVVAVLDRFHRAKLEDVDFFPTATPTPEQRALPCLPYPKTNYSAGRDHEPAEEEVK